MASTGTRRFQIEEHPLSLDRKFTILNEDEKCLYTVKSTLFALGDKLTLSDSYGNELFKIRQQLKHLHRTFHVYNAADNDDDDDRQLATVKQVGNPLKHTLEIHSVYGDYLMKRDGGMTSGEYTLSKDGKIIAEVQRKVPAIAERYSIDIDQNINDQEVSFLLSIVICLWCAQRYRGQGSSS